jgi:hypothetical protein
LPPAGPAPVDEPQVARQAFLRADTQPFGHAGPVPLDQRVRLLDQPEHDLGAVWVLEFDVDRAAARPSTSGAPGRSLIMPLPAPAGRLMCDLSLTRAAAYLNGMVSTRWTGNELKATS